MLTLCDHTPYSDHRVNLHTYKNCCSGRRLVEWTLNQSTSYRTRPQVIQMWQALLSEGILKHGEKNIYLPPPFSLS